MNRLLSSQELSSVSDVLLNVFRFVALDFRFGIRIWAFLSYKAFFGKVRVNFTKEMQNSVDILFSGRMAKHFI